MEVGIRFIADEEIPRCYMPKDFNVASRQLISFSDASEDAYAGVVYMKVTDTTGNCIVLDFIQTVWIFDP